MIDPAKIAEQQDTSADTKKMPPTFDPAYVQGTVKPFFLSAIYQGERLLLPMIDLALSKEAAMPAHLVGMLYDNWELNMEKEGLTVFIQGYQKRGPNNERKRIYSSAVTPDLYDPMYSDKIKRFLDDLFDEQSEGKPLMHQYSQRYFDLYWDLHLGVTGDDIPLKVRQNRPEASWLSSASGTRPCRLSMTTTCVCVSSVNSSRTGLTSGCKI